MDMQQNNSEIKRHFPRIDVHHKQLEDHFFLQIEHHMLIPESINNLSAGGIGILLTELVTPGTNILVNFYSNNWKTSLRGTVCWCKVQHKQNSFYVGIQFHKDESSDASIFCELVETFMLQPH